MDQIKIEKIQTEKFGIINVFVDGNRNAKELIIFTIHDLGCNYKDYISFTNHSSMRELKSRCVWVHINIPGQGDNEEDLDIKEFPSMQELSEEVLTIFEAMQIKHAVLFGEGAGANILARFAMNYDERVLGAVLIHCTGTTAGIKESIRDRLIGWKLNTSGMNPTAESYLILHRFGTALNTSTELEFREMICEFKKNLQSSINPKNLNKFILSFMNRSNISEKINQLRCSTLFVTGSLASHNHTVLNFYNAMQKCIKDDPERIKRVELIQVNDVANVLKEKPEKIAESLQYFLQGLGLVGAIKVKSKHNPVSRRLSMEQLDLPRGADYLTSVRKGSVPIQERR